MIDKFFGEYRFLSNFWPCKVEFDGEIYDSVEHAYQAAKTLNKDHRDMIRSSKTPGEAKKLGKKIHIREDWEYFKIHIMSNLVAQKFRMNEDLANMLLATGDEELVEGNTWGDTFWGTCKGTGHNHLGKILMGVRQELKMIK